MTDLLEDYDFMCQVLDGPQWGHNVPQESGWYWWRNLPDIGPKVLHLLVHDGGAQANVHGAYILVERIEGEWWPEKVQVPVQPERDLGDDDG